MTNMQIITLLCKCRNTSGCSEASPGITVDFILLAPPTDLMAVLEKDMSKYATAINHIYVMGGWVIDNTGVLRTTYNVNMDVMASSQLMEFAYDHKVDTTLWSSHIIKDTFSGGSINGDNFPNLIRMIFHSTAKALRDIQTAGKSWDNHLMEKIPKLRDIIGRHAGRQFTPADPLVIVGFFNPELIKAHRSVSVTIDQKFNNAGYLVQVYGDTSSTIKVVEEIDADIFKTEMEKSIQKIIDASG
ncbi:inosine-uridine preferring nucleoside hydrolase domain-containing protein [Ditylenchus destructor]|nr:inosine-uridine preferring nucleoside hydrolase domain-containing protein [Ditylenchus destructor]